ncbi:MAG: hypothetical protein HS110_10120 [Zoogloeaceae bacterium]|nr:hypothetical protein [Zoogloeaceae bacterium]
MSKPALSRTRPKRAWQIGGCKAFLYERPPAEAEEAGLPSWIGYRWALAVFSDENTAVPLTIVTAEFSPAAPNQGQGSNYEALFLCQFLPDGVHANQGCSTEWSNEEKFITAALDIAKQSAKTTDEPVEIKPSASRWKQAVPIALLSTLVLTVLILYRVFLERQDFGVAGWFVLASVLYIAIGIALLTHTAAGHVVASTVADIRHDASRSLKPIAPWKLSLAAVILWAGAILFWIVFLPSWWNEMNNR